MTWLGDVLVLGYVSSAGVGIGGSRGRTECPDARRAVQYDFDGRERTVETEYGCAEIGYVVCTVCHAIKIRRFLLKVENEADLVMGGQCDAILSRKGRRTRSCWTTSLRHHLLILDTVATCCRHQDIAATDMKARSGRMNAMNTAERRSTTSSVKPP